MWIVTDANGIEIVVTNSWDEAMNTAEFYGLNENNVEEF